LADPAEFVMPFTVFTEQHQAGRVIHAIAIITNLAADNRFYGGGMGLGEELQGPEYAVVTSNRSFVENIQTADSDSFFAKCSRFFAKCQRILKKCMSLSNSFTN
jgi:hypothetical protein